MSYDFEPTVLVSQAGLSGESLACETSTVQCTYFSGHHYVSFTFDKMVATYVSALLGTSLAS